MNMVERGQPQAGLALYKRQMSRQQKAAVVVRALLSQGMELRINHLPDRMQERLAREMAKIRYVTKETLTEILSEFANELESVGIHFPQGLSGALTILEGHLSPNTVDVLRDESGAEIQGNPWQHLANLDVAKLRPIVEQESIEVCSVMLSKLPVAKAAELLSNLPAERAHKIAYGVSLTGEIAPEIVARIGLALYRHLETQPVGAFKQNPIERVGSILNASPIATREAVLEGLSNSDERFAEEVRKSMFTFVNIKDRIDVRDVPKLSRAVDAETMVTALAHGKVSNPDVVEFILGNLSQRLATQMNEEINERETVKPKEGEQAQLALVNGILKMEADGAITMIDQEE